MGERKRWAIVAAFGALALVGAACGNDDQGGGGGGGTQLSGTVLGDGSSTVFPITQAVAEEFTVENPDVKVSVGVSGTGGGFEKFCAGETDIQDASRAIEQEEIDLCAQNGVEYVELPVAQDGLSVMVNPANTFAECLTVEQLKAIWEPGSKIDNWSGIPGANFPDQDLTLYGAGTDSGTFDYFTDAIVGEEGASRSDYTASEDDNVLVQGIAGDPNALGYFGFAYYVQNSDKLKLVAVDGGDGCIPPSDETINSGEYTPLSRPLFVYVKKQSLGKPEVVAFIDFYMEVGRSLIPEVGYVNVGSADWASTEQTWADFKASA
ncbi:MAG: PstS family phosphate ABC transporter substrate-binding protein [Actinomycetota bacterium]